MSGSARAGLIPIAATKAGYDQLHFGYWKIGTRGSIGNLANNEPSLNSDSILSELLADRTLRRYPSFSIRQVDS